MRSTETDKKQKNSGKRKTSGKRTNKSDGKTSKGSPAGRLSAHELLSRTEQLSSILTKGLDLAEASIRLGINLVNKFGSVAQGQIIDRLSGPILQGPATYQKNPEEQGSSAQGYQNTEEAGIPQPSDTHKNLYIVNRLPLFSGSPVQLSFSINNDSASAAKKIRLEIEDFIGATSRFKIKSKMFSIKPSNIIIAPMDFEKFVLTGKVPAEAPADSYNSWIKVSGEEEIKIPVILAVSAQP
jgi:hypothetical protein